MTPAQTPPQTLDCQRIVRGLAIRYDVSHPEAGRAGSRVPDLDLRGAPVATVFGLLREATFVLLNLGSAGGVPVGFAEYPGAGRLVTVTAELAGDHPEWASVRSMLIRPDGHIAWTSAADGARPPAAR